MKSFLVSVFMILASQVSASEDATVRFNCELTDAQGRTARNEKLLLKQNGEAKVGIEMSGIQCSGTALSNLRVAYVSQIVVNVDGVKVSTPTKNREGGFYRSKETLIVNDDTNCTCTVIK